MSNAVTTPAAALTIKQHPRTPQFRSILESKQFQASLSAALPRHISPGRMLRVVLAAFQNCPEILDCKPESVLLAIMQAAACGLEPDGGPLGQAYLIPFKGKCTFIPGYRGLVKLARNSGEVADVWAEVVYEGDAFSYELGLNPDLKHKRNDESAEPGPLKFAYAIARFRDGEKKFVVLNKREVEKARAVSQSAESSYSPWKKWESEMWKKTAVRRLAKLLPLSVEIASHISVEETEGTVPALAGIEMAFDVPAIEHQEEPEPSEADPVQAGQFLGPPTFHAAVPYIAMQTGLMNLEALEREQPEINQDWDKATVEEWHRLCAARRAEISPSGEKAKSKQGSLV